MTLLLRAVAGSRLYGTWNDQSDYDWFEVFDKLPGKRKSHTTQSIINGVDTIRTDMSSWLNACANGSHQHLDCLFSPPEFTEVDLISDFRHNYYVNTGTVVPAFQRVIKSFTGGTLKQRRHAMRLELMVQQILQTGRYNPTLSEEDRLTILGVE